MQIAFLTLFLGLVNGAQQVALDAGGGIAAIELLLDGHGAGRIGGPPWTATIDFGPRLAPHHLEARGLAADGSEAARAEQWINLPRPPAEVEIVLEGGAHDKARTARLSWESLSGEQPVQVELRLDGVPLPLDRDGRTPVGVPVEGSAHVLSAELRFASGVEARKDVVLSSDWGGDVATELTAIPVRAGKSGRLLTEKDLRGRFAAAGKPLQIATVEQEPPELFVVRGPNVVSELLGKFSPREDLPVYGGFNPDPTVRFHFVANTPKVYRNPGAIGEIFDISQELTAPKHPFVHFLVSIRFATDLPSRSQLADAVAVAGLHAAARQTPRAVVLVLGKKGAADASRFDPATARGYLAALRVPFFVWALDRRSPDLAPWGKAEDISSPRGLRGAYERLLQEVQAQQIVWLQGRHLPQSITLAGAAAGAAALELVTAPQR
ncbi:MAG TPA: hypothetical protein VHR45_10550 [Thermoanaerobaculia bacterium]|nr:hypothetical protein [Thermoanaerobaculia bacterium]